jgi:hypothetical protein
MRIQEANFVHDGKDYRLERSGPWVILTIHDDPQTFGSVLTRINLPTEAWNRMISETVPQPERVHQAIDTLLEDHPLEYTSGTSSFKRCPVCEQWSPCDVRIVISALQAQILTSETVT